MAFPEDCFLCLLSAGLKHKQKHLKRSMQKYFFRWKAVGGLSSLHYFTCICFRDSPSLYNGGDEWKVCTTHRVTADAFMGYAPVLNIWEFPFNSDRLASCFKSLYSKFIQASSAQSFRQFKWCILLSWKKYSWAVSVHLCRKMSLLQKQTGDRIIRQWAKNYCCHWMSWRAAQTVRIKKGFA